MALFCVPEERRLACIPQPLPTSMLWPDSKFPPSGCATGTTRVAADVNVLKRIVSTVLLVLPLAVTSEARQRASDGELAAYMKVQLQEYARQHRVRAAIEDGVLYGIMIEGELRSGDYEEFVALVKDLKGKAPSVYLYSAGGSAVEAMKIGRLIRTLKMQTFAPLVSRSRPFCGPAKPAFDSNCTCQSACFLMYVAGVHRTGDVLGVHRIYVDHDVLKDLSERDAVAASVSIRSTLSGYFAEMNVPGLYTDRVLAIPSSTVEYLTDDEIRRDFSGYVSDYQEWVTARCGDEASLYAEEDRILKTSKHTSKARTIGELIALDDEYRDISERQKKARDCREGLASRLAAEAFEKVFRGEGRRRP